MPVMGASSSIAHEEIKLIDLETKLNTLENKKSVPIEDGIDLDRKLLRHLLSHRKQTSLPPS